MSTSADDIGWLDFLDNEEWYEYDYKKGEYHLTEKAPPTARIAFEKLKKSKEPINGIRYFT